jgi:hypothetical protein
LIECASGQVTATVSHTGRSTGEETAMSGIFLLVALALLCIAALLYFAPNLRILNFVTYDSASSVIRINRYAASRLLLPALVFLLSAYLVETHTELAVPLFFPCMISILIAVVWTAAGVGRLER